MEITFSPQVISKEYVLLTATFQRDIVGGKQAVVARYYAGISRESFEKVYTPLSAGSFYNVSQYSAIGGYRFFQIEHPHGSIFGSGKKIYEIHANFTDEDDTFHVDNEVDNNIMLFGSHFTIDKCALEIKSYGNLPKRALLDCTTMSNALCCFKK